MIAMPAREWTKVTIRFYAVPNANVDRGNWMPVYDLNGGRMGDIYGRGYDYDEALKLAERDAREEAAHYVGDWDISIEKKGDGPCLVSQR